MTLKSTNTVTEPIVTFQVKYTASARRMHILCLCIILQLDAEPLHWSCERRNYLDAHITHLWIGGADGYNKPMAR